MPDRMGSAPALRTHQALPVNAHVFLLPLENDQGASHYLAMALQVFQALLIHPRKHRFFA
ncbi:MAG: hypothetical protein ACJ789_10155 [Thermomicrobiales bacterium]